MGKKLGFFGILTAILVYIALINWGLVAWFDFNIVEWISFGVSWVATLIYSIVAVIGIIGLSTFIWKIKR